MSVIAVLRPSYTLQGVGRVGVIHMPPPLPSPPPCITIQVVSCVFSRILTTSMWWLPLDVAEVDLCMAGIFASRFRHCTTLLPHRVMDSSGMGTTCNARISHGSHGPPRLFWSAVDLPTGCVPPPRRCYTMMNVLQRQHGEILLLRRASIREREVIVVEGAKEMRRKKKYTEEVVEDWLFTRSPVLVVVG